MLFSETSTRPNLFLSYSHNDMDLVLEIHDCLERYGLDVRRDRDDLFPGEKFEPRLEALISESDTTVLILSRSWLLSDYCRKELSIAEKLGRRIIPAVIEPLDPNEMPESIAKRHFVFFYGDGESFAKGIADLFNALLTDIDWVREQTRIRARSDEWMRNDKSSALLLRGEALVQAQTWVAQPAPEHIGLLPEVVEYITRSEDHSRTVNRKKTNGQFLIGILLAGITISTLGVLLAIADGKRKVLAAEAEITRIKANAVVTIENFDDGAGINPEEAVEEKNDSASITYQQNTEEIPQQAPREETAEDALVARMSSPDKQTRISAGARVAEAVRSPDNGNMLESLVYAVEPPGVDTMSVTGRFNTLYMLNVHSQWSDNQWTSRLRSAIERMEAITKVGPQTQDCIDKLKAKLDGINDTPDECGNVYNYFDTGS